MGLIEQAIAVGIRFQAIVSDCFYGENNAFETILMQRRLPYVLARRGNSSLCWASRKVAHTFREAASETPASAWHTVARTFRDGHIECWWACELYLFRYGPGRPVRAICATTDRDALPDISTWYLTTNLSTQQAPLAHIVRLYGLRNWIEQGYKRMKTELDWAGFMVRSERAIRRHWTLVLYALTFCWWHDDARRATHSNTISRQAGSQQPVRKKLG